MNRPKAVRPLTDLLLIFAGPVIWFAHFSFIYGAQTLSCLGPDADTRLLWAYAIATLVALAALGFLATTNMRHTGFLPRAGLALALLAIPAVIWTAIPALLLPACAGR